MNKKRVAVIWIGITILIPLVFFSLPSIMCVASIKSISQDIAKMEQEKADVFVNNKNASRADAITYTELSMAIEEKETHIRRISEKAIVSGIFLLMGLSFFSAGIFLTGNK